MSTKESPKPVLSRKEKFKFERSSSNRGLNHSGSSIYHVRFEIRYTASVLSSQEDPKYKTTSQEQRFEKYSSSECQWDNRRQLLPTTIADDFTPVDAPQWDIRHHQQRRTICVRLLWFWTLSANKQTNNEAAQILYGCNKFIFNTAGAHRMFALRSKSHLVPGCLTAQGTPPTKQEFTDSVDMIFKDHFPKSQFLTYDPLIVFIRTIGRYNTTLIKSLKINGFFKAWASLQSNLRADFPRGLYAA
ncbi:hypothetical protein DL98DRAFT_581817 [Cadophora sp. DSE1049]|nr:hypothetical protein DL98DRAFT_581817 [Cadophora sp. DSE1049]